MSRRAIAKKAPLLVFFGLALGGSVVAAEGREPRSKTPQTIEERLEDPVSRPDPKDMRTRPMGDWVIVSSNHG